MSKYADEGTIAHALAAMCLTEGKDASAYLGRVIESQDYEHAKLSPSGAHRWMACHGSHVFEQANSPEFVDRTFALEVTDEMAEAVQVFVDMVRDRIEARKLAGNTVEMLVEQEILIDHITGEAGATGTADVVLISTDVDGAAVVDVIDLKFGRGVEVSAEGNPQLLIYGSGVLAEHELAHDIKSFTLTIHQPRIKYEPSDWERTVNDIRAFEVEVRAAVDAIGLAAETFSAAASEEKWASEWLTPGDAQCKFCSAKATCPALARFVEEEIGADFAEIVESQRVPAPDYAHPLASQMAAVDLIEDWCKAVRAEVERRLLAGEKVAGFKLVQGRRGARAWGDPGEAEQLLKAMRLKTEEMYDFKLISPTTAEKLAKDKRIGPRQWPRLEALIIQADGKPSVAPESDKRPALVVAPAADDFDDLSGE